MIGSYRWNVVAGGIGFIGTLLISLPHNIWKTALVQSIYSFLFLFVFIFLIRWVLGILFHLSGASKQQDLPDRLDQEADSHRGRHIDLSTPEGDHPLPEEQLQELRSGTNQPLTDGEAGFAPLNPPKLASKLSQDPEELVKALRHMKEE